MEYMGAHTKKGLHDKWVHSQGVSRFSQEVKLGIYQCLGAFITMNSELQSL